MQHDTFSADIGCHDTGCHVNSFITAYEMPQCTVNICMLVILTILQSYIIYFKAQQLVERNNVVTVFNKHSVHSVCYIIKTYIR